MVVNQVGGLAAMAAAEGEESLISIGAGVLQAPVRLPGGAVALRFNGWPDAEYVVEYSSDLILWSELTTIIATAPESEVVDEGAAAETKRFYRLRMME